MTELPGQPHSADDEGDAYSFCGTCVFANVCVPQGYSKPELAQLHCLVEHIGPYPAGTPLFSVGDAFESVLAVRAGAVKTFVTDDMGREQVLGFFLPGELVGLNGIYAARYPCDAVTLDTTTLCRFSFPAIATLATRIPGIQRELFRLMSKDIVLASMLSSDASADERVAAFLLSVSDRLTARGLSPKRFRLLMSRADVANYLRLAAETVSRALHRLQKDGLIQVDGREICLQSIVQLRHIARNLLR